MLQNYKQLHLPSTSTSASSKTAGKTSGPIKNTRNQNRTQFFNLLASIQELDESDSDSEGEGVAEAVDPPTVVESDQEKQPWLYMGCSPESPPTYIDNNATSTIKHSPEIISEVTADTTIGATVPVHIGSTTCHALVDSGATRSCMS